MDLRRTILLLRSFPKLLLIISTITITAGFKLKQNGCLPLNSGKHPCLNLNYSFFIQCPENWVHITPRGFFLFGVTILTLDIPDFSIPDSPQKSSAVQKVYRAGLATEGRPVLVQPLRRCAPAPLVGEPLAKPFTLRGLPKPPLARGGGIASAMTERLDYRQLHPA